MDKGRLLLRFRTLLTRISDQLGEKEVKSIAYIYGLAEPGSALDLLQALERRGSFSFDRPQQLVELLEGAHRFDIVSTCGIKEYVEDVAAPIGPGTVKGHPRTSPPFHYSSTPDLSSLHSQDRQDLMESILTDPHFTAEILMRLQPPSVCKSEHATCHVPLDYQAPSVPDPSREHFAHCASCGHHRSEDQHSVRANSLSLGQRDTSAVICKLPESHSLDDGYCSPPGMAHDAQTYTMPAVMPTSIVGGPSEDRSRENSLVLVQQPPATFAPDPVGGEVSALTSSLGPLSCYKGCPTPEDHSLNGFTVPRSKSFSEYLSHVSTLPPCGVDLDQRSPPPTPQADSIGGALRSRNASQHDQAGAGGSDRPSPPLWPDEGSPSPPLQPDHDKDEDDDPDMSSLVESFTEITLPPSDVLNEKERCSWKIPLSDLYNAIAKGVDKTFCKELSLKDGIGKRSRPVKLKLELHSMGLGHDSGNSLTMKVGVVLTRRHRHLAKLARLNMLVTVLINEGAGFISGRDIIRQNLADFTLHDFLPHEVLRTAQSKHVEVRLESSLTYDLAPPPATVSEKETSDGFVDILTS